MPVFLAILAVAIVAYIIRRAPGSDSVVMVDSRAGVWDVGVTYKPDSPFPPWLYVASKRGAQQQLIGRTGYVDKASALAAARAAIEAAAIAPGAGVGPLSARPQVAGLSPR